MKKISMVLLLATLTIPGFARYKMSKDGPKKVQNSSSLDSPIKTTTRGVHIDPVPSDEVPTLRNLSERFEIELNRLEYLRGLHYGYEVLVPSVVIAHEGQIDVGRVIKARMDGATWEKVCEQFFVDSKVVDKQALDILVPLRKTLPKKYLTEKPETR